MSITRLLHLLDRRSAKVRDERIDGIVGRGEDHADVFAHRRNHIWVTIADNNYQIRNSGPGRVDARAGLPVKLIRLHKGGFKLDGDDDSGLLDDDDNAPGNVFLVNNIGPDGRGNVTLDPDDLDDTATTHKFTTAAEASKLAGIAAGAEVNVNADWIAVSGDAFIANKPTIPTLPVKATGTEVDTGTDDAKFVTPKAMEDSAYIKAAYADAKVTDAIADGVTTIAPSQNAVFDALATKQPLDATLTSIAGLGTAADKMLYTTAADTWAELATLAYGRSLLAATNIAAAQTTLALVPGTNVQAFDATLLSIAALGTAADRMLYTTAVDTWAELTTTSYGRSLLASAAAVNARATLGLVIGTDVQAQDAELAALAGLTSAADKLPYFTGLGTAALADLSAFARTLIDDAAAVNMRTTLGLIIGTDVQAQDAELAAIAGLTSAADSLPYFTGLGAAALATFTAFGRTMAALADAAAGRTALALGSIATLAESLFVLLAGRAGGQTINGGTAAGENLTLSSTAHATKGKIFLGAAATSAYDGVNDRLGIGTAAPVAPIHAKASGVNLTREILAKFQMSDAGDAALMFYNATSANSAMIPGIGGLSVAAARIALIQQGFIFTGTDTGTVPIIRWDAQMTDSSTDPTNGTITSIATRPLYQWTNNGAIAMNIDAGGTVEIGGLTSAGASILGIKAGASTNDAAVEGGLYVNAAAVGNVGTGDDDLMSYSVPANTLSANNMEVYFEAWGTYSSANAKTLKVKFGAASFTIYNAEVATGNWYVKGRIVRTGAATQDVFIKSEANFANASVITISTATETLSGAVTLKLTGTATNNNEVVQEYFKVWWGDANT